MKRKFLSEIVDIEKKLIKFETIINQKHIRDIYSGLDLSRTLLNNKMKPSEKEKDIITLMGLTAVKELEDYDRKLSEKICQVAYYLKRK